MWSCVVITLYLSSLVNWSHFDLNLNHLAKWDQTMWEWSLDGSLHSLLFIWSYPKSNMASTTETRGFMPRRVFCMWSIYFDDFFFVFLVKFALCVLPLLKYKGKKMGPTPKIFNFYFKSEFFLINWNLQFS